MTKKYLDMIYVCYINLINIVNIDIAMFKQRKINCVVGTGY